jgi:hypothetical protein
MTLQDKKRYAVPHLIKPHGDVMKIGEKFDRERMKTDAKPVVLMMQPEGYIEVRGPEELRQWEENARALTGVSIAAPQGLRAATTCSAGCADDCGVMA